LSDDELLLRVAGVAASHAQVDDMLAEVVRRLRVRGMSWSRIGAALGITRQSAWERFSGEG
jgi:ATP-dependent Clp protease ATP-binding subunit ClpX